MIFVLAFWLMFGLMLTIGGFVSDCICKNWDEEDRRNETRVSSAKKGGK